MLAWRGLEILEILAGGTPEERSLGWAFSLSDDGDTGGRLAKIPRAWDTTIMLANQASHATEPHKLFPMFRGDPPLKGGVHIITNAAQIATLQLLLEQLWFAMPEEQRPPVPKAVGMTSRKWVGEKGIKLTAILGLPEPPRDSLREAAGLQSEQDCDPEALQVLKQGPRYQRTITTLLRTALRNQSPFDWLTPFAPLIRQEGLTPAFSKHTGRIVLVRTASD
jgi:hypothetical protein